jgi:ATP-dependent DNA helicase RecQ
LVLIKIFTIPFSSSFGGFNDEELRGFLADKELISASDYLFTRNDIPYVTLVLKYFPYRTEALKLPPKAGDGEEWRRTLSEEQMGLFNLLRDWRSKRCKKDGVPPYVLLNNNQLAMIVRTRPQSLADLIKIEGIGKKKIDAFGLEILEITKLSVPATANDSTATSGEPVA